MLARGIYARRLKRTSEGLLEDAIDEPLDTGTQTTLEDAFRTKYGWPVLAPEDIGTDSFLRRAHREFISGKPSMFAVSKVKSLAMTQPSSSAGKRRCAPGVAILIEGAEESEDMPHHLIFLDFFSPP